MAPEIIKGEEQGFAVDWWSFGVLIYEMLYGQTPFHGSNTRDILKAILSNHLKYPEHFSKEVKDLLKGLLNPDPKQRLGSRRTGIKEIKNHKFFKGIDWAEVANRNLKPPFVPILDSD